MTSITNKFVDLSNLFCPLCGTELNEYLKVGVYHDLLMEIDVMSHMICAEAIGGYRLLRRVCHWRGADGVEKSRWVTV